MVCAVVIGVIAAQGDTTPAAATATDSKAPATTAVTDSKAPVPATASTGTAPVTPSQTESTAPVPASSAPKSSAKSGGGYLGMAIWAAVIGAVFAFLWSKGYLVKIRNYFAETREELKKCSWPSRDELKGSTVVILVTTALLGLFTVGVDWVLSNLMRLIT